MFVLSELLGQLLTAIPSTWSAIGWLNSIGSKAPESPDYEAFVGPLVGAQASFLALFFATVGIVVSTSYSKVPSEVRRLFVEDKVNTSFVGIVIGALVVGISVLLFRSFGYQPSRLTLIVLAGLAVTSIAALARLSIGLFEYFDISILASPLRRKYKKALSTIARNPRPGSEFAQQQVNIARLNTRDVFTTYRKLTQLLTSEEVTDIRGAARLGQLMLYDWAEYSAYKPNLATDSVWYERVPKYKDGLALGFSEYGIHAATRTVPPAEFTPDPLFIERQFVDRICNILTASFTSSNWLEGTRLVGNCGSLVKLLGARWQVEEAAMLVSSITQTVESSATDSTANLQIDGVESPNELAVWAKHDEALAETGAQLHLQWFLGFVASLSRISIPTGFSPTGYRSLDNDSDVCPHKVREVKTRLITGLAFEKRTEGKYITPAWWIDHQIARAYYEALLESTQTIFRSGQSKVIEPVCSAETPTAESAPLQAQQAISALELIEKYRFHSAAIHGVAEQLLTLRSSRVTEPAWPEPVDFTAELLSYRRNVENQLAQTLEFLYKIDFAPHQFDSFGNAYNLLEESLFQAVLRRDTEHVQRLFPRLLVASQNAQDRVFKTYGKAEPTALLINALAYIARMMDLSGYALLVSECGDSGPWDAVRGVWERLLSSADSQRLVTQLLATAKYLDGAIGISPGGVARTNRKMQFNNDLRERDLLPDFDEFGRSMRRRRYGRRSHQDARMDLLTAFSRDYSFADASDVFIVGYLRHRPEYSADDAPRSAEELLRQIEIQHDDFDSEP